MSAPPLTDPLAAARTQALGSLWRAQLLSLASGLLLLLPMAYMFQVYGRVLDSRNLRTLAMLTLLVLFALAIREGIEWARAETLRHAAERLEREMGPAVFRATHDAGAARPEMPAPQALQDLRTVADALEHPATSALMDLPVGLVLTVALALIDPWLAVAAGAGVAVQSGLGALHARRSRRPLEQARQSAAEAQRWADAAWRQSLTVAAMGMRESMRRRWTQPQRLSLLHWAGATGLAGLHATASRWLQLVLASGLLGLAAWLWLIDALPSGAGTIVIASVLGARVLAPWVTAIAQWKSIAQAREAWVRLGSFLRQWPPPADHLRLPPPQGRLSVEGLVASAPGGGAPLLKGLGFALEPGEWLAVIGPSGSGKSTLARLLTGVWRASSGGVRLDGVDLPGWNKHELGPYIGYLPQGVGLVDGTVAENIARFGPASSADVEAAARAAGVHEAIAALPQGYATPVGFDGRQLSGGEQQGVALARALLGSPVLVVLDEPDAYLDEAGDRTIHAALRQLRARGATVVMMLQRPGLLAWADKVLVLRDGRQQAFGPRDEVLRPLPLATVPPGSPGATPPFSAGLAAATGA